MKSLYKTLATVAFFLMMMLSVISVATTREEATASHLGGATGKWRIVVLEENFHFSKQDEAKLKADVLGFFDQAGSPTRSKHGHYFVYVCIVFVFSLTGYLRERWLVRGIPKGKSEAP